MFKMSDQIKPHIASLESINLKDQIVLLAGILLEDEAIYASVRQKPWPLLAVAGHMLGGKVHGFLAPARKRKGQTPQVAK